MFGTKKEKSPYGASTLIWEKSANAAPNCTKRTFFQNRNESHLLKTTPSGLFSRPEMKHLLDFSFFSNLHHEDFSPNQNGKFVGCNVLLLLTFSFFEPHRGSRGLHWHFQTDLCIFFLFRFSGVATSKPYLELFSGPKNKKL